MTAQHTIDAASGVRLIGGEVMTRDLPHLTRPGAVAFLLNRLLGDRDGRLLLAGPRAATLLDVIRPDRPVDVIVRSLVDARDLTSRAQERGHLQIHCGGFDRFESSVAYDVVVCLDGPEGLLTPDSEPLSHAGTAERLGALLAENGQGLLAIANDLGLDNVFRLEMRTLFDDDASWYRGGDAYDQRSAIYPELEDMISGAGLRVDDVYCGYPTVGLMSLLVAPEVADAPGSRAAVEALISRIETESSGHRTLVDLYPMSRRFLAAGLGRQTASGWLVLIGKGAEPPEAAEERPQLVLSEDGVGQQWASIMTAHGSGEGWTRSVTSLGSNGAMIERRVTRDLSAVGDHLPVGDLLEPMLRAECERGNLTGVRRLVRAYDDYLTDGSTWTGDDVQRRFFAVPSNVVVSADGSMGMFDGSWAWAEELSAELSLVRGLRDFARRLLQSGGEHPWQPDISPDALVQTLLAMVGRPWDPTTSTRIAEREAELEVVLHGGDALVQSQALAENLAGGASQFSATSAPSRGYREALSSLGRMSQELHERGDQVEWLEASLRQRDQRVNDLQGELTRVKSSASFLLGRRLTAPVRTVRDRSFARARATAIQMLPPNFAGRAQRALRKAGL